MNEVLWRIFYADGSKISNLDVDDPQDAPARGVVAVWSRKGVGRASKLFAERCAFFVYDREQGVWYDCDYIGMVDRILMGNQTVKLGRYVPDDVWEMIRAEAELSDGKH